MSLKYGLLGLLNYGSMTGYELNKAFESSLNFFWQAQKSQIYRELNAMEKENWLKSKIIYQKDKPNKKEYTITDEGKSELEIWLKEEDIKKDLVLRDAFLMKIFFSGVSQVDESIKLLETFKKECKNNFDRLKLTDDSIDYYNDFTKDDLTKFYWKATANFGKEYLKMSLKWADNTIEQLEKEIGKGNFKK